MRSSTLSILSAVVMFVLLMNVDVLAQNGLTKKPSAIQNAEETIRSTLQSLVPTEVEANAFVQLLKDLHAPQQTSKPEAENPDTQMAVKFREITIKPQLAKMILTHPVMKWSSLTLPSIRWKEKCPPIIR